MSEYLYRAYGLALSSPLELPFPAAPKGQADVNVTLVSSGNGAGAGEVAHHHWNGEPGRFILSVQGVAEYCVEGGNSITITAASGASTSDLVAFLMSSAIGVLLQQRGTLPLHASAVATDRGALLIAGKSGAGKSTTMAALTQRGFAMMSDDITPVILDGATPVARPAYPSSRLWGDALQGLGQSAKTLAQVREKIDKFYLPIGTFHDQIEPIAGVVIMDVHNGTDVQVEPVSASEAYGLLSRFSFRKRFLKCQDLLPFQFAVTTAMARAVRVIRVRRPMTPFSADQVAEEIANTFAVEPLQLAEV